MRSHRLGTLLVALFLCILGVILWRGLSLDPERTPSLLIGKQAPEVNVAWLQKHDRFQPDLPSLAAAKGNWILLNFWASWCVSCKEEAQELEMFWQSHLNIIVIGVAVQDEEIAALGFARKHGKTYPLVIDQIGTASIDYGVTGVPESFIISPEGVVRYRFVGPTQATRIQSVLEELKR